MDRQINPNTCLAYMTTGCLIENLVSKKSLADYTHIVIDEVHERDEDTDLLLLIVRKFLRHTESSTKVVLMSATVQASKFADYFSVAVNGSFKPATIINVENQQQHAVSVYYLDDMRTNEVIIGFLIFDCLKLNGLLFLLSVFGALSVRPGTSRTADRGRQLQSCDISDHSSGPAQRDCTFRQKLPSVSPV